MVNPSRLIMKLVQHDDDQVVFEGYKVTLSLNEIRAGLSLRGENNVPENQAGGVEEPER